jgi:hypothetical protein
MVRGVEIDGRGEADTDIVPGIRGDGGVRVAVCEDFIFGDKLVRKGVVGNGAVLGGEKSGWLRCVGGSDITGRSTRILSLIVSALSDQSRDYNGHCRTFALHFDDSHCFRLLLPLFWPTIVAVDTASNDLFPQLFPANSTMPMHSQKLSGLSAGAFGLMGCFDGNPMRLAARVLQVARLTAFRSEPRVLAVCMDCRRLSRCCLVSVLDSGCAVWPCTRLPPFPDQEPC